MLLQLVLFDNTARTCIGIREISLQFIVTPRQRQRVDCRHAILEEIAGIVIIFQIAFFAPAQVILTTIFVLELRQADCMIDCEVGRESDALQAGFPFLCRDQDHAVGCLRTVKSSGRGSLQNTHTLDIIRVQVGYTVTGVTVTGVVRTSHSRRSLLADRVQHRNTVDHI